MVLFTSPIGVFAADTNKSLKVTKQDNDGLSPGILIDNNDVTNDTAGIQIDMVDQAGIPLVLTPTANPPTPTVEGGLYANSSDNNLYYYDGTSWVDLTGAGGGKHLGRRL